MIITSYDLTDSTVSRLCILQSKTFEKLSEQGLFDFLSSNERLLKIIIIKLSLSDQVEIFLTDSWAGEQITATLSALKV